MVGVPQDNTGIRTGHDQSILPLTISYHHVVLIP